MRVYLTWLLLVLACSLTAQDKLEDLSFYLEQHARIFSMDENSTGLPDKEYKAPWIERMELRTETRDWELVQQEYQFRVRPTTPKVRKYQMQVYQDLLTELENIKSERQIYGVKKIYEDWVEDLYEHKSALILESSRSYYDDLIKVLSTTDQKGNIDALEIIKVKIKKEELELKIKNLKKELVSSGIENSLIDIDEIRARILLDSEDAKVYPTFASDLFDLQKIENKYALEKAEKNRVFDFAQVTYRGPHDEIWQERMNVSLAFRIPKGEKRNFDMLELQIERMMEQEQIKEKKVEYENSLLTAKEDLLKAIVEYDERKEILAQLSKYDEILENYNPSTKSEILDLISLKMDGIDDQLDLIRLEENIYEQYIDFLDSRSILSMQPSQSHLTN